MVIGISLVFWATELDTTVEDIGKENVTGVDVAVETEDAADDNVEDVEVRVEDDLVCDAEREQSTAIKLIHLQ